MLGYFSVGKTSLVKRFVESIFSEKYHSTIGVKIDKKRVTIDGVELNLMIWDLAGDDSYENIKTAYLKGASGFLVIADGTQSISVDIAIDIRNNLQQKFPNIPFIILINKDDLKQHWEVAQPQIKQLQEADIQVVQTSAKTGVLVKESFEDLGRLILSL